MTEKGFTTRKSGPVAEENVAYFICVLDCDCEPQRWLGHEHLLFGNVLGPSDGYAVLPALRVIACWCHKSECNTRGKKEHEPISKRLVYIQALHKRKICDA